MKKVVKLTGLIHEVKTKGIVSPDSGGRLIVDFNIYNPQVMADLTALALAEAEVTVTVAGVVK